MISEKIIMIMTMPKMQPIWHIYVPSLGYRGDIITPILVKAATINMEPSPKSLKLSKHIN